MITVKIKSIGVRELVEFSLKSGDLKSSGAGRQNTALDGSRIHRMIQASWDDDVSVETDLQTQITAGKTPLLLTDVPTDFIKRAASSMKSWK